MQKLSCLACGHVEHGESSYCMNPSCGQLLPVATQATNQRSALPAPAEPAPIGDHPAQTPDAVNAEPTEPWTARLTALAKGRRTARVRAAPTEPTTTKPTEPVTATAAEPGRTALAEPAEPGTSRAVKPQSTAPAESASAEPGQAALAETVSPAAAEPMPAKPVKAAPTEPLPTESAKPAPAEAVKATVATVAAAAKPSEPGKVEPPAPTPMPAAPSGPASAPKARGAVASVMNARRVLLGGAALLVLIATGVAFTRGVAAPDAEQTSPSDLPTASQVANRAPEITRVQDERVAVTLGFTDPSNGAAAFYVVGGPSGRQPTTLAEAPRASTTVRVNAVNPDVDYCFVVVAVLSVDEVAPSVQVCTSRFGTAKP